MSDNNSNHHLDTDQRTREASGARQYGRYLEEFKVGDVYKHWPAKTVTEADDHLFCLITMNHHPLHINDLYAGESQQGQNVVVGPLVYSLMLGMSVGDVSGKAIANLATEELSHPAPVFHGDTLFVESEVLEVRESKSKQDRGIVKVKTDCYKQDGTLVATFKRSVLVPRLPESEQGETAGAASGSSSDPTPQSRRVSERRRYAALRGKITPSSRNRLGSADFGWYGWPDGAWKRRGGEGRGRRGSSITFRGRARAGLGGVRAHKGDHQLGGGRGERRAARGRAARAGQAPPGRRRGAARRGRTPRRDAEAFLAERIRRIAELSDAVVERGEGIVMRLDRAEEVRRQLQGLADALGESAEELAARAGRGAGPRSAGAPPAGDRRPSSPSPPSPSSVTSRRRCGPPPSRRSRTTVARPHGAAAADAADVDTASAGRHRFAHRGRLGRRSPRTRRSASWPRRPRGRRRASCRSSSCPDETEAEPVSGAAAESRTSS